MTEAAQSKPGRPLVSAPALWTGIALGTFLAVEALRHGVMLPLFGGFADAILTFVLLLAAGVVVAEVLKRHHRPIGRGIARGSVVAGAVTARHGKRGASAAYSGARRHGGRGAAFVAGKAKSRWDGWRTPAEPGAPEAAGWIEGPPLSVEWDTPPAPHPSSDQPNSTGGTNMADNGTRQPPRVRRTVNTAVPGAWGAVVAHTADFQAESDGDLLNWMRGQAIGARAYAEALVEQYETCRNVIGLDPPAIQMIHDAADAATTQAVTMAAAVKKFAEHYELPTQFVSDGGLLAHDGRWHKGDDG
jgi:hypothetical protein